MDKKAVKEKLRGVFAPVVTPFDKDKIRADWLEYNLEKLGNTKLTGYLALGSNGEWAGMNDEDQLDILRIFEKYKADKVVMAGCARESTLETIEFSKKAIDTGVDFVSILTPHYFAKRIDGATLLRYYLKIADSVTVPILLYNAPGFAGGVQIPPLVTAELADHPNIVGMKDSSPAGMNSYLAATGGNDAFHILAGSAGFFFPALLTGATGGVLSLANAVPNICCDLYSAVCAGNLDMARSLHTSLYLMNKAVSGSGGVSAVKAAMDLAGFHGGNPRHPLAVFNEKQRQKMKESLTELDFFSYF